MAGGDIFYLREDTVTIMRDRRVAVISSLPGEQRWNSLSRKVSGPKRKEKSFCCGDPHPVWRQGSQDLVGIGQLLEAGCLQEGGGSCGNGCLSPLFTIQGLALDHPLPTPIPSPHTDHSGDDDSGKEEGPPF